MSYSVHEIGSLKKNMFTIHCPSAVLVWLICIRSSTKRFLSKLHTISCSDLCGWSKSAFLSYPKLKSCPINVLFDLNVNTSVFKTKSNNEIRNDFNPCYFQMHKLLLIFYVDNISVLNCFLFLRVNFSYILFDPKYTKNGSHFNCNLTQW